MSENRIYIAGCGGMLGEAFHEVFSPSFELKCTDIDVNAHWLSFLDFRDLELYMNDVLEFRPDFLFHLGAFTDLEFCERNPDETYRTNTLAVENAVFIANSLNIPLLYISTAGIFDGKKEVYDDWDIPRPIGTYARSKWAAEVFVTQTANKYLVCRAGWMMGGGPEKDKKFVQKIMLQLKRGEKDLFVVDDKLGTPTYTYDFAVNVKALLERRLWGLYNIVCSGMTSRIEVAKEIIMRLGVENSVKVYPVSSDYFSDEYFAPRPASERLESKKLKLRNLYLMRDWRLCLKEYIEKSYSSFL